MPSIQSLSALLLVTLALAGCHATPPVSQPASASSSTTGAQPASAPQENLPQGIAVGEPAPGSRMSGTTAILTPCRREFMNLDANGDGWLSESEWPKDNGDFKARDTDGNGLLDNGEYGCQDTAPNGGSPDGKR